MKLVGIEPLLSPEWAKQGGHFITTQYGASIQLITQGVHNIELSFEHDFTMLAFAVKVGEDTWQYPKIDSQKLCLSLPEEQNEYHVEVMIRDSDKNSMFLWQHPIAVTQIAIDAGKVKGTDQSVPYITFVGDSITAGEEMADDGNHPEKSYPYLVAQNLKKPLNRIAYGGTGLTAYAPFQEPTAIEALWHEAEHIMRPRIETDIVVVNYGTNDFNYQADFENFAFGLRIYLLELIKRFHNARIILLVPLNGAFQSVFESEVQRFTQFEILDTSNLLQSKTRVHPNCEEHELVATRILKGI